MVVVFRSRHSAHYRTSRLSLWPTAAVLVYMKSFLRPHRPDYSSRLLTNTLSTTRGKYSSVDEYHLQIMRQVFVRWTNTLSKTRGKYSSHGQIPSPKQGDEYPLQHLPKTWGKYSSHGRIPSPKYGASIRPMDEYPLQHMGQAFVLWTNTPTRNLGQVLTRGRVVPIRRMDLAGIR